VQCDLKSCFPPYRHDILVERCAPDVKALQKALAAEELRNRLNFSDLNIPAGAVSIFDKVPSLANTVAADGKLECKG